MHIHSEGTHLPLAREVTITSRNTEDECIEGLELVGGDDGVRRLRGCVEKLEDVLRKSLGNPKKHSR